jgi:hypothetical protein
VKKDGERYFNDSKLSEEEPLFGRLSERMADSIEDSAARRGGTSHRFSDSRGKVRWRSLDQVLDPVLYLADFDLDLAAVVATAAARSPMRSATWRQCRVLFGRAMIRPSRRPSRHPCLAEPSRFVHLDLAPYAALRAPHWHRRARLRPGSRAYRDSLQPRPHLTSTSPPRRLDLLPPVDAAPHTLPAVERVRFYPRSAPATSRPTEKNTDHL